MANKRNPDDEPFAMPPVGMIAAAGLAFLGLRALFGGKQEQAPPPPAPRAPGFPMQQGPLAGMGAMGRDSNGIPIVPLPAQSAARSAQIRTPTIPGIVPQGRSGVMEVDDSQPQGQSGMGGSTHPYAGETFGGVEGQGGLGGEVF